MEMRNGRNTACFMVESKWNALPDGALCSARLPSLSLNDDGLDRKTKQWHQLLTAFVCCQVFYFPVGYRTNAKCFFFVRVCVHVCMCACMHRVPRAVLQSLINQPADCKSSHYPAASLWLQPPRPHCFIFFLTLHYLANKLILNSTLLIPELITYHVICMCFLSLSLSLCTQPLVTPNAGGTSKHSDFGSPYALVYSQHGLIRILYMADFLICV